MRLLTIFFMMVFSTMSFSQPMKLSFKDHVTVKKVQIKGNLKTNLSSLFRDLKDDSRMIASKKEEKKTWSGNLRQKLQGQKGEFRI